MYVHNFGHWPCRVKISVCPLNKEDSGCTSLLHTFAFFRWLVQRFNKFATGLLTKASSYDVLGPHADGPSTQNCLTVLAHADTIALIPYCWVRKNGTSTETVVSAFVALRFWPYREFFACLFVGLRICVCKVSGAQEQNLHNSRYNQGKPPRVPKGLYLKYSQMKASNVRL